MALHRGRLSTKIEITEVAPLTREDLVTIREKRTLPVVARFRDPHHRVARLIATGMRPEQVAMECGYSISRIYTLSKDPSFLELVAEYRKDVHTAFVTSQEEDYTSTVALNRKALRQLHEKIDRADEENELLPTKELLSIFSDTSDRVGISKKTTNLNVNIDFAAKLEAAAARAKNVIEGRAVTPSSVDEAGDSDPTPMLRRA